MRSKIVLTILGILFCWVGWARATSINFDASNPVGSIEDNQYYDQVTLHDSAVVTMTGGTVNGFSAYDNSVLNISGGILQNTTIFLSGSSTLNISGGLVTLNTRVYANQLITNVYGRDLNITPNPNSTVDSIATGHWGDGTQFTFQLMRTSYDATNIVFHEVPEPSSLLLFGAVGLAARKRSK